MCSYRSSSVYRVLRHFCALSITANRHVWYAIVAVVVNAALCGTVAYRLRETTTPTTSTYALAGAAFTAAGCALWNLAHQVIRDFERVRKRAQRSVVGNGAPGCAYVRKTTEDGKRYVLGCGRPASWSIRTRVKDRDHPSVPAYVGGAIPLCERHNNYRLELQGYVIERTRSSPTFSRSVTTLEDYEDTADSVGGGR